MLSPGSTVGRYVVKRKLAEGGMAEIYLAAAQGAEGFSKEVVIKVVRAFLAADRQFIEMFLSEARLGSRLNHANVVQIFDFGKADETYYLAMEFVRGASLWDLRRRCRELSTPFPPVLAADIGAQVARGLQYAHSLAEGGQLLGIVHRDVTPHNVLLSFDGAVKLTDFGIAKASSSHTAPGMLKGKFAYMSPEQARGDRVDARTDVFALGIVLWEMLTGGRLFDGDSDVAVLRAVQDALIAPPSRLNPDVPAELSDIVLKALARPVADRFGSAFELDRALATFVLRNAKSIDDTNVGTFLQRVFQVEFEADHRSTSRLPPVDAAAQTKTPAAKSLTAPISEHDLAHGDTLAIQRAKTMTATPVGPVGEAPRHATPAVPDVSTTDVKPSGNLVVRVGTEQQPALPVSRPPPDDATLKPGRIATEAISAPLPAVVVPPDLVAPASSITPERPQPKSGPNLVIEGAELEARLAAVSPAEDGVPDVASDPTRRMRSDSVRRTPAVAPPVSTGAQAAVTKSKGPLLAMAGLGLAVVVGLVAIAWPKTPTESPSTPEPRPATTIAPAVPPVEPLPAAALPPVTPELPQVDAGASPEVEAPEPSKSVEARPDPKKAAANQPPAGTGAIEVRATPYARVVIDGKMMSSELEGRRTFRLSAGEHTLLLEHPAWAHRRTITIKSGQLLTIYFEAMQKRVRLQ